MPQGNLWRTVVLDPVAAVLRGLDPLGATAVRMMTVGLVAGAAVDVSITLAHHHMSGRGVFIAAVLVFMAAQTVYFFAARHVFTHVVGLAVPLVNIACFGVAGAYHDSNLWYAAAFSSAWLGLHFGYRGLGAVALLTCSLGVLAFVVGTGDKEGHEALVAWLVTTLSALPTAISHTSYVATSRSLIRGRRLQQSAMDAVDVGIMFIDSGGQVITLNPLQQELLELALPDGADAAPAVFDVDGTTPVPATALPNRRVLESGDFSRAQMWLGADPDTRRAVEVTGRQARDPEGRLEGATLAFHDVSELVSALRAKDEFVSSVSHELRTPLTSIIGYVELMLSDDLADEARSHLERVHHNAWRLRNLVEDLLSVTAEVQPVAFAPVQLDALIESAASSLAVQATRSGVRVDRQLVPASVAGESERLERVVVNLISNALKYTEVGGIVEVEVEVRGDTVHLRVRDSGVGIDADEQARIFERFYRTAAARVGSAPGLGLGLGIARDIVQAHGGAISVASTIGVGSVFEVTLPRCDR